MKAAGGNHAVSVWLTLMQAPDWPGASSWLTFDWILISKCRTQLPTSGLLSPICKLPRVCASGAVAFVRGWPGSAASLQVPSSSRARRTCFREMAALRRPIVTTVQGIVIASLEITSALPSTWRLVINPHYLRSVIFRSESVCTCA